MKINVNDLKCLGVKFSPSNVIDGSIYMDNLFSEIEYKDNIKKELAFVNLKQIEDDNYLKLLSQEVYIEKENDEVFLVLNNYEELIILNKKTKEQSIKNKELLSFLEKLLQLNTDLKNINNNNNNNNLYKFNYINKYNISIADVYKLINKDSISILYQFLSKNIFYKNQLVFNELIKENKDLHFDKIDYNIYTNKTHNLAINFYNISIDFDIAAEKLLKINKKLLFENINKSIINFNDNDGKINNVVNLPKFVLNYINKNNYFNILPHLIDLNLKDGNDYRFLIDFLENSKVLVKPSERNSVFRSFIEKLAEIYNIVDDYKIKDLLAYLIKESYFNGAIENDVNLNLFEFPLLEASYLLDYLNMAKNNGVEPLRYPDLIIDHNIMQKNLDLLKSIDEKDFLHHIDNYKDLTKSFINDEYIIITPDSIKSIIEEGNALHHCVASYSHNIIKGKSKIFFLRKKEDPQTSFFSIELNKNNELNHMRGKFQELPDKKLKNIIVKWTKSL